MDFLAQTREGAKAEIARIDAQIADLTSQRARLQVILDATETVTTTAHERFNKAHPGLAKLTMAEVISIGLRGAAEFSIGDGIRALEDYGWPVTANIPQIVRNTLLRRSDLFGRKPNGQFFFKESGANTETT